MPVIRVEYKRSFTDSFGSSSELDRILQQLSISLSGEEYPTLPGLDAGFNKFKRSSPNLSDPLSAMDLEYIAKLLDFGYQT